MGIADERAARRGSGQRSAAGADSAPRQRRREPSLGPHGLDILGRIMDDPPSGRLNPGVRREL